MRNIKVSIVCISYNQEKYIAQALDSFVSQKTNFDFEAIIADDCSIDSTPRIINEYAKKYPNIIKTVLRKKNIGVQANLIDALKRATGDYIALCEGDDYWTDEHKLQRQVNYLDRNDDYSLCFHPVNVIYDNNKQPDAIFPVEKDGFTLKRLLKSNYIQTNSVMYKRREYDNIPLNILPMDWYLHLYHAKNGKIGFLKDVMSVYRRHNGGLWWSEIGKKSSFWQAHAISHLTFFVKVEKLFRDDEVSLSIAKNTKMRILDTIISDCSADETGEAVLTSICLTYPIEASQCLVNMHKDLDEQRLTLNSLTAQHNESLDENERLTALLSKNKNELSIYKNSRPHKLLEFILKKHRNRRTH